MSSHGAVKPMIHWHRKPPPGGTINITIKVKKNTRIELKDDKSEYANEQTNNRIYTIIDFIKVDEYRTKSTEITHSAMGDRRITLIKNK